VSECTYGTTKAVCTLNRFTFIVPTLSLLLVTMPKSLNAHNCLLAYAPLLDDLPETFQRRPTPLATKAGANLCNHNGMWRKILVARIYRVTEVRRRCWLWIYKASVRQIRQAIFMHRRNVLAIFLVKFTFAIDLRISAKSNIISAAFAHQLCT
jgi:hypothetical protein